MTAFLPTELIEQILTLLTVKALTRFRSLNKWFNNLISEDPFFLQMHLNTSSSQNPQFMLTWIRSRSSFLILSFPITRLLDHINYRHSPPIFFTNDYPRYRLTKEKDEESWSVAGSCNGLLCLRQRNKRICLWNPATNTKISKTHNFPPLPKFTCITFGYDNSSSTYKAIAYRVQDSSNEHVASYTTEVNVIAFSSSSCTRRTIQPFPFIPIYAKKTNFGVYLNFNSTINWLAVPNHMDRPVHISLNQCVILSLHLSTETYTHTHLLLPEPFHHWPHDPILAVLSDSLCFCHDFGRTHFVIWQMKDFGVEDSWVQLYKISYESIYAWGGGTVTSDMLFKLKPLYYFDHANILILVNSRIDNHAFIYDCTRNKGQQIRFLHMISWRFSYNYVKTLIS